MQIKSIVAAATIASGGRVMGAPCTWCGTEHEAEVEGFCSEDCRSVFHTACQLWGEGQYGAGEVSIFQLRSFQGSMPGVSSVSADELSVDGTAGDTGTTFEVLNGIAPEQI